MNGRTAQPGWRRAAGLATLLTVLPVGGACRQSGPSIAAVVEGTPVPASALSASTDAYLRSQAGKARLEDMSRREVRKVVLTFQIKRAYLDRVAAEMGVTVDTPDADLMSTLASGGAYRQAGFRAEDLVGAKRAGRLSAAIAAKLFPEVSITDADLERAYEERAAVFQQSWTVAGPLAVLRSKEAAEELRRRVAAGAEFAASARAVAAVEVGQVQVTPLSPLPQGIIDAVEAIPTGRLSDPIQAGVLWAVLRADQRQHRGPISYDAARPQLTLYLADQKRQPLFADWFDTKLKAAQVRVDSAFGRWDPDTATVT
jgi:hypothetical protein